MTDPPRSPKVRAWHLTRSAVVYVRQSTLQQVAEHRESTARQYALAGRATDLGWPRDRVQVIDDDLGRSGQSAEGRPGFQRLLAEVALDQVGLILGLEVSRLARSCKDWHQLLEACARFRVLLADADGVYDPCDYNDRLLLGLKSSVTYPTPVTHPRDQGWYPRRAPPRGRRPHRHRDGLLLEGGCAMARPATIRRAADGRTGRLDRIARRHVPADTAPAPAPRPGPVAHDSPMSPTPGTAPDPSPAELTPDTFWGRLPAAEREQFGLRLSRLVLKAARVAPTDAEENP
jgi:hypothetical protein